MSRAISVEDLGLRGAVETAAGLGVLASPGAGVIFSNLLLNPAEKSLQLSMCHCAHSDLFAFTLLLLIQATAKASVESSTETSLPMRHLGLRPVPVPKGSLCLPPLSVWGINMFKLLKYHETTLPPPPPPQLPL